MGQFTQKSADIFDIEPVRVTGFVIADGEALRPLAPRKREKAALLTNIDFISKFI